MGARTRTREQLLSDAAYVIGSPLSYGSKYALLDNICWVLSEFDGKYDGCRWWSREALLHRADLRHEHAVPRKVLITQLLSLKAPDAISVQAILDLCTGVVVTKAEDHKLNLAKVRTTMPQDWDGKDVFARYRHAGIELVDTREAK